jgi:hypothetical protein
MRTGQSDYQAETSLSTQSDHISKAILTVHFTQAAHLFFHISPSSVGHYWERLGSETLYQVYKSHK